MYQDNYLSRKYPSFLIGIARILDIRCALNQSANNFINNPIEIDQKAIYSDWKAIGDDIGYAISNYVENL